MRSFVRSKILDPSRSISSADCRPAASPICCTPRKAYSRYRDLHILALSLVDSTDK